MTFTQIQDTRPFFEAEFYCTSHDGHLVTIQDDVKQEMVATLMRQLGVDVIWTAGFEDQSNLWKWVSGKTLFTH